MPRYMIGALVQVYADSKEEAEGAFAELVEFANSIANSGEGISIVVYEPDETVEMEGGDA